MRGSYVRLRQYAGMTLDADRRYDLAAMAIRAVHFLHNDDVAVALEQVPRAVTEVVCIVTTPGGERTEKLTLHATGLRHSAEVTFTLRFPNDFGRVGLAAGQYGVEWYAPPSGSERRLLASDQFSVAGPLS